MALLAIGVLLAVAGAGLIALADQIMNSAEINTGRGVGAAGLVVGILLIVAGKRKQP